MGLKSLGNPQSSFDNYSATTGTDASSASAVQATDLGVQATGGTTNTYFIGNSKYKSHTFTNGQTFQVTALSEDASTYPNSVDLLLVGGGGGGGGGDNTADGEGGGGGGGGVRTTSFTATVVTYGPIPVGSGGAGGSNSNAGGTGGNTTFTDPAGPTTHTAGGGGEIGRASCRERV